MALLTESYGMWLVRVKETLDSINMPMEDWQTVSAFDFKREFADRGPRFIRDTDCRAIKGI
jgi:hypothetical protein